MSDSAPRPEPMLSDEAMEEAAFVDSRKRITGMRETFPWLLAQAHAKDAFLAGAAWQRKADEERIAEQRAEIARLKAENEDLRGRVPRPVKANVPRNVALASSTPEENPT